MDFGQVILGFILPVHGGSSLITDEDLIVRLETIILVARYKEAVRARHFRVIEQLRLNLRPVSCKRGLRC